MRDCISGLIFEFQIIKHQVFGVIVFVFFPFFRIQMEAIFSFFFIFCSVFLIRIAKTLIISLISRMRALASRPNNPLINRLLHGLIDRHAIIMRIIFILCEIRELFRENFGFSVDFPAVVLLILARIRVKLLRCQETRHFLFVLFGKIGVAARDLDF